MVFELIELLEFIFDGFSSDSLDFRSLIFRVVYLPNEDWCTPALLDSLSLTSGIVL